MLGKEEVKNKHDVLARELIFETNIILAEIDGYLRHECKFGRTLTEQVNEIKKQIIKISETIALFDKGEKAKKKLEAELNILEVNLRNLELEINRLRSEHQGKCHKTLHQISQSSNRLRLCVAGKIRGI